MATDLGQKTRDEWISKKIGELKDLKLILDAGCGDTRYRHLFNPDTYESQDHKQYGTTPPTYQCDIHYLPMPSNKYDLVMCTEVLEHVSAPVHVLFELTRVTKVGGYLLLTAPQGSREHQQPHYYYGGFSWHWYQEWLTQLGCEIVEMTPANTYPIYLYQEISHLSYSLRKQGLLLLAGLLHVFVAPLLRYIGGISTDHSLPTGWMVLAKKIEP